MVGTEATCTVRPAASCTCAARARASAGAGARADASSHPRVSSRGRSSFSAAKSAVVLLQVLLVLQHLGGPRNAAALQVGGRRHVAAPTTESEARADTTLAMDPENACEADSDCGFPRGKCLGAMCLCKSPFSGPTCGTRNVQVSCEPACRNGGQCKVDDSVRAEGVSENMYVCACPPAWTGKACMLERCPLDCSNRGRCQYAAPGERGSICLCPSGWTGPGCDRKVCPGDEKECSGHGRCRDGACHCELGYAGEACATRRCDKETCSGHGECSESTFTCSCDPGWFGTDCRTKRCPVTGGGLCGGNGECDQRSGRCECESGWAGESCTQVECAAGLDCSGHGACGADRETCVCELGWHGDNCGVQGCPMNCLSSRKHGICADGKCQCFPGFEGDACERPRKTPPSCGKLVLSMCQAVPRELCGKIGGEQCPLLDAQTYGATATGRAQWAVPGKFPGAACFRGCLSTCMSSCRRQLMEGTESMEALRSFEAMQEQERTSIQEILTDHLISLENKANTAERESAGSKASPYEKAIADARKMLVQLSADDRIVTTR